MYASPVSLQKHFKHCLKSIVPRTPKKDIDPQPQPRHQSLPVSNLPSPVSNRSSCAGVNSLAMISPAASEPPSPTAVSLSHALPVVSEEKTTSTMMPPALDESQDVHNMAPPTPVEKDSLKIITNFQPSSSVETVSTSSVSTEDHISVDVNKRRLSKLSISST